MKTAKQMLAKYSLLFSLTLFTPYKQEVCMECLGCRMLPISIYDELEIIDIIPYCCPYCHEGHEMTTYGEIMEQVRQPKDFITPFQATP